MYQGKPIIGIAGGIGSGKSYVARLFGEEGCLVIHSDEVAHEAYQQEAVRQTLRQWWGLGVFKPDGSLDRAAVAARVFEQPEQRRRLEGLIHPIVNAMRERRMREVAGDPAVKAFVWDTPLLFETGLDRECDAVVFVDAPFELRLARVARTRGWDRAELERREKSQMPLDKKRQLSDDVIANSVEAGTAEAGRGEPEVARGQVREVLSRILAGSSRTPPAG